MTRNNNCPRCGSDNLTKIEEQLEAGQHKIKATKCVCSDCDTRFYFEEQIIDYLKAVGSNLTERK